jgi:hypothetical protein
MVHMEEKIINKNLWLFLKKTLCYGEIYMKKLRKIHCAQENLDGSHKSGYL